MKDPLELELGNYPALQSVYETAPAAEPAPSFRPWTFVSDFQQAMGENAEPDPLFFVETWTLGAAAAAENFKQRNLRQAENDVRTTMCRQFGERVSQFFVQENAWPGDEPRSFQSAAWRTQPVDETAVRGQNAASPKWGSFAEQDGQATTHPMTEEHAYRVLGVSADSTRHQIKAAYRRMVTEWHPDRFGARAEKIREQATEKMAAINEAYRLLRSQLPHVA